MFQNRTAEKNSSRKRAVLPTQPLWSFVCSAVRMQFNYAVSLGVSFVNYLPTPPPPPAAKWRRPWQTWEPRPYPAAPQGLCSSPTCRRRPRRLRPHRTDSQRTSGEGLRTESKHICYLGELKWVIPGTTFLLSLWSKTYFSKLQNITARV